MNVGGDGMRFCGVVMKIRNGSKFVTSKFDLKSRVNASATVPQTHRTYFEDAENPIEAQPPANDCLLLLLKAKGPRDSASFTLLHNVSLDLVHNSVIGIFVNRVDGMPARLT